MSEAPAHDFLRTESLSGRSSSRKVQSLIESMRTNGWLGEPISVIEIGGQRYIIDGHHRVYAARIVNIEVKFRVIDDQMMLFYGYESADSVIQAYAEAAPNRIRLR